MDINVRSLIAKLNDFCRRSLEGAAGTCLSRSNYNVEVEHWMLKLLETPDCDLARILRFCEIDPARLARDVTRAIDKMKTGNSRAPALSPQVVNLVREAWVLSSIEFDSPEVRSGHLVLAMLGNAELARLARESMPDLGKVPPEDLRRELRDIVAGSSEDEGPRAAAPGEGGPAAARGGKTPSLDQFTVDLTARARNGDVDPVLGRDFEIRQIIDILTRRRQNNPILTGEAGVGKTAVVEGFALRIAVGDVPPMLKNVSLRTLDLALLQAGAGVKGEFENRLKSVIQEVKSSPQPIILFIDEAHTMIGAGGQAGMGDAANLLKPALARGELRTIAATTWSEYKKYFEKDAALARRFQVVKVEEPDEKLATVMLRGFAGTLEKHHGLRILDEAIQEAVRLSNRYITGRQLPDKAVSLLDTACAKVAMGYSATPAALEDCRRQIDQLGVLIDILTREAATGADNEDRIADLQAKKAAEETRRSALEQRWKEEAALVTKIRDLRGKLEQHAVATLVPTPPADAAPAATSATPKVEPVKLGDAEVARLKQELQQLNGELGALQGEQPLMHVCVEPQAVAEVVSSWTGIPVGKMVADEIKTVLTLREKLEERIIGQSHALETISERIRTSRAALGDPRRPIGVFLLVGPSGVGKTETAISLADMLYGGERNMIVINMSEYLEAHTVSKLKGSPAGYVGFGEGGVLTEAVRRKPYSVLLLDEVEKAHPDVLKLFYQVFDKGMLEDAEGREIDFKNTIILLTSNACTDVIMAACADLETRPGPVQLAELLHPKLLEEKSKDGQQVFQPAFLGRLNVVPYFPLSDEVLRKIVRLQLGRIAVRLRENHRAELAYDEPLIEAVARRCTEVASGARNVDHIITRSLLPEIAREILSRMAEGLPIERVHVSVDAHDAFTYDIR